jgi:hypothetical protein
METKQMNRLGLGLMLVGVVFFVLLLARDGNAFIGAIVFVIGLVLWVVARGRRGQVP